MHSLQGQLDGVQFLIFDLKFPVDTAIQASEHRFSLGVLPKVSLNFRSFVVVLLVIVLLIKKNVYSDLSNAKQKFR